MSIEASHRHVMFCFVLIPPPPPPLPSSTHQALHSRPVSSLPFQGGGEETALVLILHRLHVGAFTAGIWRVMSSIPGEFRCFLYSTLLTTELTSFLSDFISRSFKQVQGLGTALKILFSGHELDDGKLDKSSHFHLKRTEIVSLFNAFGR